DTTSRNELEKHLRFILKDIKNLTDVKNIINLLKLLFDHDKLHCIIGTRTLSEYRKYNETNSIFEKYFQYVLVKETSVNDCILILRGVKLLILDLALVTAAGLTNRYIPNPYSPEKTIGPNSVGKTELAKTLALELFDSTEKLISIDMNKYTTSNSIAQLFDSSFGKDSFSISELFDFVDFKQNDQLLEGMRQQPYAVILFNQIEKVHPQFWNNLSQVLDHNHSLNEKHVNVDLTNTILIFKSNVVAQITLKKSENFLLTNVKFDGKISQTIKDFVIKNVVSHFPENFIRHVNDIVFFQPLTYNQLSSVIQLQVISIEERFKEKNIKISLTNKAIQSILQKSYKLFSGFSPVKDHIEKHITSYLSTVVSPGHIRIDTDVNDQYQLSIEQ
ncbi:unnamed protein product, partial [Rotaria sp. Silwood2]